MAGSSETVPRGPFGLAAIRGLSANAFKGAAVVVSEVLAPVNRLVESRVNQDRQERQQRDIDASLALGQAIVGRWAKGPDFDPSKVNKEGLKQIRRAAEIHGLLDFGFTRDQATAILEQDITDMLEPRPTLAETLQVASKIPRAREIAEELPFATS